MIRSFLDVTDSREWDMVTTGDSMDPTQSLS
jgi:hypothetical protein